MMYNLATNTTVTTAHEITGSGGFRKIGEGTLAMTRSNSFAGGVMTGDGSSLSGGVIRFLNPGAFGDPSVSKTVQVVRAEVRLEGGMSLPAPFFLQTSANAGVTGFGAGLVAFRNVAGTNTIPNTIELIGGAGSSEFTSDAGLLVMNGPIYLGNNPNRDVLLSGTNTGLGILNGPISNQPTNTVALQKRGSGTWILTAASTYRGATTVSGGTLLVNGSIGGSTVSVQNSATLGGSGSIGAPVTVQVGGTIAPGTSIGTLTLASNLTIQGKAVMEIARNGSVLTRDFVTGVVTNTYGGTLIITNVGTSALQPGDSFKLFAAAVYLGAFTNIVYPAAYTWTNSLAVDGTVSVVAVSGPPTLQYTFSGSSLTFTWTGSYKLQAQTNSLDVGISNNWHDVAGGGTSGISVPVSTANGTVFFRLAQ
jgi:autotransporter-associated beta strand protein